MPGTTGVGAPFWYNTLRSLMSLRSIVATDIHEETRTARLTGIRAGAEASATAASFQSGPGGALTAPVKPGAS